jgi:hypothetical protein
MIRIAHAVKVVAAPPGSEWAMAQPITFASMRVAKEQAKDVVDVAHLAAFLPAEREAVPVDFLPLPPLTRDITALGQFRILRPLPLLRDVLDRLYENSDADYLLYTNVDIALQPHFYSVVAGFIAEGADAIVINRRSLLDGNFTVADLPLLCSLPGTPHPGYDCFVFHRSLYPSFILGDVCLGTGHVDLPFICSLIASARNFRLYTHEHLTFHIGDRRVWRSRKYRDYLRHNDREAANALHALAHRAPRKMRPWMSTLLAIPLLKNSFFVREFRRMFRGHQ